MGRQKRANGKLQIIMAGPSPTSEGERALAFFDRAMARLCDLTNRPLSEEARALIAAMRSCLLRGAAVTPAYFAQAVALLPVEERASALVELRERANTWLLHNPQDHAAWQLLSICLEPSVRNVAEAPHLAPPHQLPPVVAQGVVVQGVYGR